MNLPARRRAVGLAVASAALLLVVACGSGSGSPSSAEATGVTTSTSAPDINLTGRIIMETSYYSTDYVGRACGGWGDVTPNAQVQVRDGSNNLVGAGSLGAGTIITTTAAQAMNPSAAGRCAISFSLPVQRASFYQFTFGIHTIALSDSDVNGGITLSFDSSHQLQRTTAAL